MCMEDVRLGRKSVTLTTSFISGAANGWQKIAEQRPDRYSLTIRIACADVITYTTWVNGTPPTVPFLGLTKDVFIQMDLQQHGDLVTQPFWVVCNSASIVCFITEVFLGDR